MARVGLELLVNELGNVYEPENTRTADLEGWDSITTLGNQIANGLRLFAGDLADLLDSQSRGVALAKEVKRVDGENGHFRTSGVKGSRPGGRRQYASCGEAL
jgi:hypothetical protein